MTIHLTVADLARQIGGEAEGDLTKRLSGVAPLAEAGEAEVAFADSDRALEAARSSRAGCLLVSLSAQLPGQTLIRVRNPKMAMARAAGIFNPESEPKPGIHPSAVLGDDCQIGTDVTIGPLVAVGHGARIGARTRIGAGCVIGAQVSIGEQCVLHPRVTLYPGARLGSRVILHSGCVIGADGFGYVFEEGRHIKFPQVGRVEIGDDVEIGANTTIDRGALGATRIGRGTKIDNLVQIAHNVQIGAHCAIAAQTGISGSAVIEDDVVIAGQAGIGDHARVSKGAVLGGQCGILPHKVAKAGQPLWGTPARPLRDILEQQASLARLPRLLKSLKLPAK